MVRRRSEYALDWNQLLAILSGANRVGDTVKGISLVKVAICGCLLGCREDLGMLLPSTSEQLALAIQPNTTWGNSQLPEVRITAGPGIVTVLMTRRQICGGQVVAGLSRAPGDLAIVVRQVSSDSLVVCAPLIALFDYTGTITALPPMLYRVRVFEAESTSRFRLIGSATVSVSAPAT